MAYLRLCYAPKGRTWCNEYNLTRWESIFWTKTLLKHWNCIFKLAIYSDKIYNSETPLSNNFSSFLPWNMIFTLIKQPRPPAPLTFSISSAHPNSVSYILILGPGVLSWTSLNILLVSATKTYSLNFCPVCLVIPFWVNLAFTVFTFIPKLPSVIRESQINRVLPWNKFMCCNLNWTLQAIPQWCSSLIPWWSLSLIVFQTFPLSSSLQPDSP